MRQEKSNLPPQCAGCFYIWKPQSSQFADKSTIKKQKYDRMGMRSPPRLRRVTNPPELYRGTGKEVIGMSQEATIMLVMLVVTVGYYAYRIGSSRKK
ncbi:hypothetical protein HMPREF9374_2051 [Desmospora sp. 8437]|nr:hypothetical protein HMPREF9374_2051 [Desmospora sp. 8437]